MYSHIVKCWLYKSKDTRKETLLVETPAPDADGLAHATVRHLCHPNIYSGSGFFRVHFFTKKREEKQGRQPNNAPANQQYHALAGLNNAFANALGLLPDVEADTGGAAGGALAVGNG